MAAKNTKTLIVTAFVFNGDEVSMKPARKLAISVETVYMNYPLVIVVDSYNYIYSLSIFSLDSKHLFDRVFC